MSDERVGGIRGVATAVSLAALLGMAAAAVWIVPRAMAVLDADSAPPLEWVPVTFPARAAYERFTSQFGSGDVVVVSWEGCTLTADEPARLAALCTGPDAPGSGHDRPWFEPAVTGKEVVDRLTEPPLSLTPEEAVGRLSGGLIGPDGTTTCVVVPFTRAGLDSRRAAIRWLRHAVASLGIPSAAVHMAGPVVDNVTVDAVSQASLATYGPPAALVVLLLTWRALGSLLHAGLVFLISLLGVGLAFALLHAIGDSMSPVLIVMPLLILVLGVSGGVHLVNYLKEASRSGPRRSVAIRAVTIGWLPCALSAGTTAVGLLSLVVSELDPIRVFGFHAAIGVMATVGLQFLVIPGAFQRWPIHVQTAGDGHRRGLAWMQSLSTRHAATITTSATAMLLATAAGLPSIRTSVSITTLFTPENQLLRDYAWIEGHVGPLAPVEVVVRFPEASQTRAAERLDIVQEVAVAVTALPGVTGVLSAATFFSDGDATSGVRRAARKAVAARRLEAALAGLDDLRFVRRQGDAELWRVTARTPMLADLDYGEFLDEVRTRVEPILDAHDGPRRGITLVVTGAMPLVHAIQRSLLHDLLLSFLTACGVITLVMVVVQRGILPAMVAMIVNVYPMILLFGLLGWGRVPLDIGGIMTASVALGMAIDGTLHFLTFFQRRLATAGDTPSARVEAVNHAFRHTAAAIAQTAVICIVGMLVFTASSFAPTRRFAWMMATLVALAMAGDLLLLPAMLVGATGAVFGRRGNKTSIPRRGRKE